MQLTFPNGEHASVSLDQGEVTVGSRSGNRVSLPNSGLAAHHASFMADRRGVWMRVPNGAPSVHLNARPVKRLALLRAGDLICLDKLRILVKADETPVIDRGIPATQPPKLSDTQRISAVRVVLRGVSGSNYGRTFSLTEPKIIGRSANADIRIDDPAVAERHASIELHADQVVLRALAPGEGTFLNGSPVRDAVLAPGDQLVIEQHRFILDAPGLPPRGHADSRKPVHAVHTQTIQAVKVPTAPDPVAQSVPEGSHEPAPSDADGNGLWWLIAAAAVLAAAITALLVYTPRG